MNATQFYRLLLQHLYPRRYREAFGDDMLQTFSDYYADAKALNDHAGVRFWASLIADDLQNAGRQHLASLTEGDGTVTLSVGRLALAALFLIPLFVFLSAASIMVALAVPHPPVNGIIVPIALVMVGVVVPGVFGAAVSWGLAGVVQGLWSKRPMGWLRA
jgi:hypothetical protein